MSSEKPPENKIERSPAGVMVEAHVPASDSPDSMLDLKAHLSSPKVKVAIRENVTSDDSRRVEVEIHKDDLIRAFRAIFPGLLESSNPMNNMQMFMGMLGEDAGEDFDDDGC